eukprot:TRINITY_DN13331_c0_g1_i1.p1 TRINITY_DN13331_c0_g1~~TRINITY_DN13331_c0_g1_i1.p1  ORF type:complete len:580 (+),score=98.81 TRINITY_DN13331_c0_g1_i1:118-1740(+)
MPEAAEAARADISTGCAAAAGGPLQQHLKKQCNGGGGQSAAGANVEQPLKKQRTGSRRPSPSEPDTAAAEAAASGAGAAAATGSDAVRRPRARPGRHRTGQARKNGNDKSDAVLVEEMVTVPRSLVQVCHPDRDLQDQPQELLVPRTTYKNLLTEHASQQRLSPLTERTMAGFAQHLRTCRKVVVLTGAGISASAGIPDFRTPGTGLYARLEQLGHLQRFGMTRPEEVFDLEFFRKNPRPFYTVARHLWPGRHCPTRVHHFIRLLHEKGMLLRTHTQNFDDLERAAGVPAQKLVQWHGSFSKAHCIDCRRHFDSSLVLQSLSRGQWPRCSRTETCRDRRPGKKYRGLIKPSITFFHEDLVASETQHATGDLHRCDALIVLGTSLQVQPFGDLPNETAPQVPRLYINRNAVETGKDVFVFCPEWGVRDVAYSGDCDDGVTELCTALGWADDLASLEAAANEQYASEQRRRASTASEKGPSQQFYCAEGHSLQHRRWPLKWPGHEWVCDGCGNRAQDRSSWWCQRCDYDLCQTCTEEATWLE